MTCRRRRRLLDRCRQLVKLGDRLVELQTFDRLADCCDGSMEPALKLIIAAFCRSRARHEAPDALDEPRRALDSAFGPFEIALRRAVGEHEPADGVSAIFGEDWFRVDRVALRLRHLLDAARHNRLAAFDMN